LFLSLGFVYSMQEEIRAFFFKQEQ
jgi:hypothetical protein